MCRKSIYYNVYGDGTEDVTERVDTCRAGKMCTHPDVREYKRSFRFSKLAGTSSASSASQETSSSLAERKPTPYHSDFLAVPSSPRKSKSPSPSRATSGVYVNGTKIADINSGTKKRSSHHRSSDRVVVVPHAPEPPSPRRILNRSNTMPEYVTIVNEPRGRTSRPSSATSSSSSHHRRETHSRDVTLGPVHAITDLGRRTTRHVPRTPRDERHHHSSRRSAAPAVYYYSSDGSDTPAAAAVRKELRWQDQVDRERTLQNDRISRRATKPAVSLHQEVKGILKKSPTTVDELRRAVERMDIQTGAAAGARDEDRGRPVKGREGEYWDRLRDRFEEPGERKRRTRVSYPGESVYKYM